MALLGYIEFTRNVKTLPSYSKVKRVLATKCSLAVVYPHNALCTDAGYAAVF